MAAYMQALRTSRQLFPEMDDWLAFLAARLLRKLGWGMPRGLRLREFKLVGLELPVLMRPHTSDFNVAREMFVRREYQRLLDPMPSNVGFVLDLGANIGLSVRLWQTLFPEAQIVALEPDSENAELCRENMGRGAGQHSRSILIQAAVAPQSGFGVLETAGATCSHRLSNEPAHEGHDQVRVRTLSVPDILREVKYDGPIDLLKCDIEGSEKALFAHCHSWAPRVRALLAETHGDYTLAQLAMDLQRGGSTLRLVHSDQRGPQHALGYFVG